MNSTQPFSWEMVASGNLACEFTPTDFDEGEFIAAGQDAQGWRGDDLRRAWSTHGPSYVFAKVEADRSFEMDLIRNSEKIVSHSKETAGLGVTANTWNRGPAQWLFAVDNLLAVQYFPQTSFMIADGLSTEIVDVTSSLPRGELFAATEKKFHQRRRLTLGGGAPSFDKVPSASNTPKARRIFAMFALQIVAPNLF